MAPSDPNGAPAPPGAGRFATTRWSLVRAAGHGDAPESREALAALCRAYWYPLYAYVRRRGAGPDQAQDLTQEFFARLLEKDYLRAADRRRGKFRSFLLAAFQHFLSKERDRARARKRGGGRPALSLDFPAGESRYASEPADERTPEKVFERRWALALLGQVLARLRAELTRAGKRELFERLKGTLTGEKDAEGYARAAAALDMTEGAVKVAVHRLRRRYAELLRDEIAETVAGPEEVEEELRQLFHAVRAAKP